MPRPSFADLAFVMLAFPPAVVPTPVAAQDTAATGAAGPAASALPAWRATGNEPSWTIEITDGVLHLARLGAPGTLSQTLPPPRNEAGARVYDMSALGLEMRVRDELCHDTMTGMPYPQSVDLQQGNEALRGCGGEPAGLLIGNAWKLEALDGRPVPAGIDLTLAFVADGGVAGRSGCNRFAGGYALTGDGLGFGHMAATRMACPEPQMALEREFHAMLARVTRFDIDRQGRLRLIAGDEVTAEAGR